MNKRVQLIISDFLLPESHQRELCADLNLPTLRTLLARATYQSVQVAPSETYLCQLFGLEQTPIARLSAKLDGVEHHPNQTLLLRADPVYLRLQRDKLILLPTSQIQQTEADEIIFSLNQHFADQGLSFLSSSTHRWYLQCTPPREINSVLWSQALGNNVNTLLPKGGDALWWHQLLNEIQMLLFNHPVNQQREEAGQLPINSVWFWGEGTLTQPQSPYTAVCSDNELADNLALATGTPIEPWATKWQSESEYQLLVWSALSKALIDGDLFSWQQKLLDFELNYLTPLWKSVKQGTLKQLDITLIGKEGVQQLSITPWDRFRFWRNSRNLL